MCRQISGECTRIFTEMSPIRDRRRGNTASKYIRLLGQYHPGGVSSVSFAPDPYTVLIYELQRVLEIPVPHNVRWLTQAQNTNARSI